MEALHEFIPHNFSFKYRNPCWYSSLDIPHDLSKHFAALSAVRKPMFNASRADKIIKNVVKNLKRDKKKEKQLYCLPLVYLAAFPRCGTTYLFHYLVKHPMIAKPARKEGHFWSTSLDNGTYIDKQLHVLWYLDHFKPAAKQILTSPNTITIDGSPSTLLRMSAQEIENDTDLCVVPSTIAKLTPNAKFIVVMRDPVKRLFSDFWFFCSHQHKWDQTGVPKHYVDYGQEVFHNLTAEAIHQFHSCVDAGIFIFNCVQRVTHRATFGGTECFPLRLGLSMYYYHIVRWLAVVPREGFLFIKSEDLFTDLYSTLQKVWSFLGLRNLTRKEFDHITIHKWTLNTNDWIRSEKYRDRFVMLPETEKMLREFYRPHNKLLAQLLSDDRFLWEN